MIWDSFPQIQKELERVQSVIIDEVRAPGGELSKALVDLATRDAKLLRPAFTVMAARFQVGSGPVPDRIIRLAAAIEMLHMASLVHDDIVDDAIRRRGKPSLHVQYGPRKAVLMGDYLFSRCFNVVAEMASPENARLLASSVTRLLTAEIDEANVTFGRSGRRSPFSGFGLSSVDYLLGRRRGSYRYEALKGALSVRHYLRRIIGKTAILFAASFHVGASESGGDEFQVRLLRRIGYNIGVGFQVIDDILDIAGDSNRTGKPVGTDLQQGVITLPVILALQSGTNGERQELERLVHRSVSGVFPMRGSSIDRAVKAVRISGALSGARAIAGRYTERALREIDRLPEGSDKQSLTKITELLLARAS